MVNFATEDFEKPRQLNTRTAYRYGATKVYAYSLDDIDTDYRRAHADILELKRGCGYWLWKPYFLYRTMLGAKEGDWVIYADTSMCFIRDIREYIANLENEGISILCRTSHFLEKHFTKRDVFLELDCDSEEYTDTTQRQAGLILVKNTEKNRGIIEEWLHLCENMHLITDEQNCNGLDNYEGYVEHRHDSSLWSLVCKKHHVPYNTDLFKDILLPGKKNCLMVFHHTKASSVIGAFFLSIPRGMQVILAGVRKGR